MSYSSHVKSHKTSSRSSRSSSKSSLSRGTEYAKLEAETKKVELQCRMEALKLKQAIERKEQELQAKAKDFQQQKEMIEIQTEINVEEAKIVTLEKYEESSQALSDYDDLPKILIDDNISVSKWLDDNDNATSKANSQTMELFTPQEVKGQSKDPIITQGNMNVSIEVDKQTTEMSSPQETKAAQPKPIVESSELPSRYLQSHVEVKSQSKDPPTITQGNKYAVTEVNEQAIKLSSPQGPLGIKVEQSTPTARPFGLPACNSQAQGEVKGQNKDPYITQQGVLSDLATALLKQSKHASLPQRDMKPYDGDPLQYYSFIKSFQYSIESKTDDEMDKLYFLDQHTVGEPNHIVKGYLSLGQDGFQEAMKHLKKRFGDRYVIAEAFKNKAKGWPDVKRDDAKAWSSYATFLSEYSNTMKNLNCLKEIDHSTTIKIMLEKIPYPNRHQWRLKVDFIQEAEDRLAGLQDYVSFVEKHMRVVSNPVYGDIHVQSSSKESRSPPSRRKGRLNFSTNVTSTNKKGVANYSQGETSKQACCYCNKDNHSLEKCWSLQKLPVSERVKYLKDKGMCFGCLKVSTHVSRDCKNRLTCSQCQRRHPTILHKDIKPDGSDSSPQADRAKDQTKKGNNVTCGFTGAGDRDSGEYFPVILPVRVRSKNSGQEVVTYAFIDDGSNSVFCTENLQNQLCVRGRETRLTIETLTQTKDVRSTVLEDLEVSDIHGDNTINLPEVYTQAKIPVSKENILKQQDITNWNYLQPVKLQELNMPNVEIGLLIGNNVPQVSEPLQVINSQGNGPFAIKTRLGWTVHGVKTNVPYHSAVMNRIDVKQREDMHRDLVNLYNMEFTERLVDDAPERSKEDQRFIDLLSKETKFVDGHFEVVLPLRSKTAAFPNNRPLAEQRAAHLKRRFLKDEPFKEEYKLVMSRMISNGYAEEVPAKDKDRSDGKVWYIPHHGVHHPRKGKLRVVYDCGATYKSVSLNNELLQGPNLTNNLVGVLLRFRKEPVALMADIEAMYHQVKVPVNERDLLRFLWWRDGDINSPLVEYRMTGHIFGSVSSPACAMYALQKVADGAEESISEVIQDNFYVDDLLCSTGCEPSAINLANGLKTACKKRGFNLTKWVSNRRSVLRSIPETERAKEVMNVDLGQDQLPTERALGMLWNVETDNFGYRLEVKQNPHTRRGILSCVSAMYDPLGFIAPALIPAKKIMQELCRLQVGWDAQIPMEILVRWQDWLQEIPKLSSFNVSRCFKPTNFGDPVETQLHHFCDASESAYGTVSYLRLVNKQGDVHCQIVLGKARVTPLKQISIPRLELTAATVAVRVDNLIKKELKLKCDTTFWTDSTTVLKYINNKHTRFHTFVANRIAVIAEACEPEQWRYVPTAQNPADDCSRGMKVDNLLKSSRWISGPDFLQGPECQWPRNIICEANMELCDDPEVKKTATVAAAQAEESEDPLDRLIEHYSSWHRLKRAVAWVLKIKESLLHRIKNKKTNKTKEPHNNKQQGENTNKTAKKQRPRDVNPLTLCDIQEAEKIIIRHVQEQTFPDEIKDLCTRKQRQGGVKRSSSIYKLNPVYTTDCLLRVGGRLSRAAMPEQTKHPLILPKKSLVTDMILHDIHNSTGHSGRNHMLTYLYKKYWVISANSAARSIIHQCVKCRRQRSKVGEQMMSDLPADRVTPDEPPFTNVGVDYFGPFEVKRGRSLVKRYGVIFTCLSTRAVHLEKADTLTTDSCINAIRRFLSRRGQVKVMRSDNGSNLVGAEKEMRDQINQWNRVQIQDFLVNRNIDWRFNPPGGSHFGGVWERNIRTVRKVLLAITQEQQLTDESMSTYLCEVEAIVNSRPITTVSGDAGDLEPLTPNHLLLLKGNPMLPPALTNERDIYARKRWKQVQYLSDLFWKRWSKEYLYQLQRRQKWIRPRENFKVGDIVLIIDNSRPRNTWQLGRITTTMPGEDGCVRQVQVKTKTSLLVRPITKLCLLLEADTNVDEPKETKDSNEVLQDEIRKGNENQRPRKSQRKIKPRKVLDL